MTRYLMLALIGLLAVAAALTPQPPLPVPGDIAASDPPAVAVCAVEEGRGRTTSLGIVSVVNGRGRFTAIVGLDIDPRCRHFCGRHSCRPRRAA